MMTLLTLAQLDYAGDNDDDEGCHLGVGENVLHAGSPLHIGGIDECQQACRGEEEWSTDFNVSSLV